MGFRKVEQVERFPFPHDFRHGRAIEPLIERSIRDFFYQQGKRVSRNFREIRHVEDSEYPSGVGPFRFRQGSVPVCFFHEVGPSSIRY